MIGSRAVVPQDKIITTQTKNKKNANSHSNNTETITREITKWLKIAVKHYLIITLHNVPYFKVEFEKTINCKITI